jgi:hypothetical protein
MASIPSGPTNWRSYAHAADVDDAALPAGCHPRRERRDEIERCTDIGGEHAIERGDVELRGRPPRRESGIVDQDVDVAGLLGKPPDLCRTTKVGCEEAALPPDRSISSTVCAPRPASRPCTSTSNPSVASFTATARPIPDVAPVTSALKGRMSAMSFLLQFESPFV